MKRSTCILWYITMCSPLKVNGSFGGTCPFHLHGRRKGQARKQRESRNKQSHGILLSFSIFEHLEDKTFTTYRSIVQMKQTLKNYLPEPHTARTFFWHFSYEMETNTENLALIIKRVCALERVAFVQLTLAQVCSTNGE
jgi:hypothetical protein